MSEMPDLVLLKVFGFFGTTRRFRLRLVCKRWRFLVDQVRQSNLCLYEVCYPRENNLSPNRELEVRPDEMVWIETESEENKVDINFEATFFRKLERLFLYRLERPANLIYQTNRLDHLKELGICLRVDLESLKLELKNLEVLSIRETGFDYLELNTPQLSILVLWKGYGRRQVKVLFPEKVSFLECEDFIIDLKPFVNLETLLVRKLAVNLAHHPKLKVLDLRDQDRELWENLRAQALGRRDLTIYSVGFRNIFCARPTDEPMRMSERFISKHYALLERPIPFEMFLDYHLLLSAFNSSIPKGLFQKLINITRIYVRSNQKRPLNHLHLIWLLKESKCKTLSISIELPQKLYDLLPDCFLDSLTISNHLYRSNSLKFDFLPKLTRLRFLTLFLGLNVEELPFDSICETLQKCRLLIRFWLTTHAADKPIFDMEIAFKAWMPKTTKTFKVNGENLQITTRAEIIRYLREKFCFKS